MADAVPRTPLARSSAGNAVFVFILQYSLTLSLFQRRAVVGLLGLPLVAAAFWTYKFHLRRVGARTRKDEEVSRLHLAIVEALATAIDAKDQTTHFHVRRVQIYAAGLGKLFNLSELELAALNA